MIIDDIRQILNPVESIVSAPKAIVTELSFDSRQIRKPKETLFFAFKTDRNDGHRYIPELLSKGVRNFVVTAMTDALKKSVDGVGDCNVLCVDDALAALQAVATAHRLQFQVPTIGITGSNGKTIVKEWLANMLAEDRHVTCSPDSYNSQIGVPMSVWQLNERTDIAVFEAGISRPDEMQRLAEVIRPTHGILTNIGMAHSRFFLNNRQKTTEKLTTHTPGDAVKENETPATCTEDGSYDLVRYCTVCGAEVSRETVATDKLPHTPGKAVKENEKADGRRPEPSIVSSTRSESVRV